jgi:hypothetical protein
MTRSEKGQEEYRALTDALHDVTPPCSPDWRFVQERDQVDEQDLIAMRLACARCPLSDLCRSYADAARPSAGMWAGRYWGRRERSLPARGES